ncbi:DUF1697 domain-containing protein, partial [Muricomes intestini]
MAALRQLFLNLGLSKVQTYIQSGNVVFESDLDEPSLLDIIYAGFDEHFGFQCDVMMRNIDEIRFLIEQLPITPAEKSAAELADSKTEHLYVYFLSDLPKQSVIDAVCRKYE